MPKKLTLDALELQSFTTSKPHHLVGGDARIIAGTVYFTCPAGCTHGPDCDNGGGGGSTLDCTE